jgi:hypothetical protein
VNNKVVRYNRALKASLRFLAYSIIPIIFGIVPLFFGVVGGFMGYIGGMGMESIWEIFMEILPNIVMAIVGAVILIIGIASALFKVLPEVIVEEEKGE